MEKNLSKMVGYLPEVIILMQNFQKNIINKKKVTGANNTENVPLFVAKIKTHFLMKEGDKQSETSNQSKWFKLAHIN